MFGYNKKYILAETVIGKAFPDIKNFFKYEVLDEDEFTEKLNKKRKEIYDLKDKLNINKKTYELLDNDENQEIILSKIKQPNIGYKKIFFEKINQKEKNVLIKVSYGDEFGYYSNMEYFENKKDLNDFIEKDIFDTQKKHMSDQKIIIQKNDNSTVLLLPDNKRYYIGLKLL